MRPEDKLNIVGFHIKEANQCYTKIQSIRKNLNDPNFKDHGNDIPHLDTQLGLHISLGHYAVQGSWDQYICLANFSNLQTDELPDTLRYYPAIKTSIRVLTNKPDKRRSKT